MHGSGAFRSIEVCQQRDRWHLLQTQKAEFEVNLPLVELDVPKGSFNFQMIEDYWDWFCNWRCVR